MTVKCSFALTSCERHVVFDTFIIALSLKLMQLSKEDTDTAKELI